MPVDSRPGPVAPLFCFGDDEGLISTEESHFGRRKESGVGREGSYCGIDE